MNKRYISILLSILFVLNIGISAIASPIDFEENPDTSPSELDELTEQKLPNSNDVGILRSSRTEAESNNTRATADIMYAGDSMTGYLNPTGDQDCFKIVPSSSGTLNVTLSSIPSGKIFKLVLQDSVGNALVFAGNNSVAVTSKSLSFSVSAGTTYYIVVYAPSTGDFSSSDSYIVSTSLTGSGGGSDTSVLLSVTRYAQEKTYWCWAACIKMAAAYQGYSKTQTQIATYVHGSALNQSADMEQVRDTLIWISSSTFGNAGYYNVRDDRFQSHIVDMLESDKPVHVACMPTSGIGHAYLIIGVDENDNLTMIDPYASATTTKPTVTKSQFLNGFPCPALGGATVKGVSTIKY